MAAPSTPSLARRAWSAGWRLVVFFLAFALALTPLALALRPLIPATEGPLPQDLRALFDASALIAILAASLVMVKLVDRADFAVLGLRLRSLLPFAALGLAVGAILIALASLTLVAGDWAAFDANALQQRGGLALAALSGVLNVAFQDLLIAGYAFVVLRQRFGPAATIAVLSTIFVALHAGALTGPEAAIPALNLFLAGVLLLSCRLASGGLWLTMGVHFAWNFLQGPVLGLSVTGHSLTTNAPALLMTGPDWITGGDFGFEGGLVATAATAAGIALIWLGRALFARR